MASRMKVDIITERYGPLFDGRARAELDAEIELAKRDVAVLGLEMVQARLDVVLKHPTGHYQEVLKIRPAGTALSVWGGTVSKGEYSAPWLEGTSKRNESTRFKGYHTFRKVFLKLRVAATPLVVKRLDALAARWNA